MDRSSGLAVVAAILFTAAPALAQGETAAPPSTEGAAAPGEFPEASPAPAATTAPAPEGAAAPGELPEASPAPVAAPAPAPAEEAAPAPLPQYTEPVQRGGPVMRPVQSGFTLGARWGLTFPGGDTAEGAPESMGEMFLVGLPVQFELGARLPFGLGLGGYLKLGVLVPDCNPDVTCSAVTLGIGLQAEWRFNRQGKAMPWVGMMAGFEYLSFLQEYAGTEVVQSLSGVEWGFQGGVDFRAGRLWSFGPFAQLTFGTYDHGTVTVDGTEVLDRDLSEDEQAGHRWFTLGFKAAVTF